MGGNGRGYDGHRPPSVPLHAHTTHIFWPAPSAPPAPRQALEFLRHAFDAFPHKDYCVVTLPHDSGEPALMASMGRLPPLPGASFPEVSPGAGNQPALSLRVWVFQGHGTQRIAGV